MPKTIRLYTSRKVYAFAVILAVAWCLLIFVMSSMPASVSAEQSGSIAELLAPIFVADFEELDTAEKTEVLLDVDHIVRKITHFGIYAVLGAFFAFVSLYNYSAWVGHLLLSWIRGALYAASDELHQAFVPGRGAMFSDVVLDSAGVLFGVVFVLVIAKVWLNRKS